MNVRVYVEFLSEAKILRNGLRGDIVQGMARSPLFQGKNGGVMAVTWPFHDYAPLDAAKQLLNSLGYETYIQKRSDHDCYELVIGRRDENEGASDGASIRKESN